MIRLQRRYIEKDMIKKLWKKRLPVLLAVLSIFLTACGSIEASENVKNAAADVTVLPEETETVELSEVPEYSGEHYAVINGNEPDFTEEEISEESYEEYGEMDELGRCTGAIANIGQDLMPTEERGSIGQVKPSGWHTVKYDVVDGKYLYNRCHLIGYQLTAENANEKNLITGTRYMNVEGMLPFEEMVADYIKETANHVLYLVKPVYDGDNLVASGVQMEAQSVEDQGEAISFNVFVYNVQPGIVIDYETGESSLAGDVSASEAQAVSDGEIRGNKESKIYHCPGQAFYEKMEDSENLVIFQTEQEAIDAGYRKAKR